MIGAIRCCFICGRFYSYVPKLLFHCVGGVSYLEQEQKWVCTNIEVWNISMFIRDLRRVEQLLSESELLSERSLIDLRVEILKMNVKYLEGVSRILSHKIEDDYHS